MVERAKYIHFDGMDLAGKTTARRNFVQSTGKEWRIRHNRITPENPIHDLADSMRYDQESIYDAEVLGNLYVAALVGDIKTFQWPEEDTIQDSTILLRSLAFHTAKGTPRLREILLDLAEDHPMFNASFVLTASIEVRKRRLDSRIENQPDELSEDDFLVARKPELFVAMEDCLIDMSKQIFNSRVIDTSELSPEAVVSIIRGSLKF